MVKVGSGEPGGPNVSWVTRSAASTVREVTMERASVVVTSSPCSL